MYPVICLGGRDMGQKIYAGNCGD